MAGFTARVNRDPWPAVDVERIREAHALLTGEIHGPCHGGSPTWDLPVDGETQQERAERHADAVMMCRRCPLRQACLLAGHLTPDAEGVWGGVVFDRLRGARDFGGARAARRLALAAGHARAPGRDGEDDQGPAVEPGMLAGQT